MLVLNETELGSAGEAQSFMKAMISHVSSKQQKHCRIGVEQIICVTLGKRGAVALVDGETIVMPGRAVKAVDTTGAGDCFVGALSAQLALGRTIRDALGYANAAASISVQRMGAAPSMPIRGGSRGDDLAARALYPLPCRRW